MFGRDHQDEAWGGGKDHQNDDGFVERPFKTMLCSRKDNKDHDGFVERIFYTMLGGRKDHKYDAG